GIIKPILNTVGLTRDKEDRQGDRDKEKLSRTQIFSTELYKNNRDKVSITSAKASASASKIYENRSPWYVGGDNEEVAVGQITNAGSLVNISYIASKFNDIYGLSLEAYLSDNYLEPEHFTQIDNYTSKMKKF
ncbi:hypothetical protein, partial [Winogradskyella sp.]|uniref:hypothetical protein n=1 Tax=Winogradskyella sp. TaxID=1883156 RepID=UPI003F694FB6